MTTAENAATLQDVDTRRSLMSRIKRIAPYFLIGPISGPLLAGVVINFREGRPVLGSLYVAALAEYTIMLPLLTAHFSLKAVGI